VSDNLWVFFFFLDFYSIRNKIPYLINRHFWRAHLQLLLQSVSSSLINNTVILTGKKIILWCLVKQSLWVHQASVMTCFFTLINTHEVHDAYEKHTWVYSVKKNYHCCHILDERKSFGVLLMSCKFDALLWAYLIQREKPSYVTFLQALKLYFLWLNSVLLRLPSWNFTPRYKLLF